jgi:hypothetical protein
MRAVWASLLILCVSACGAAPASEPSAAIQAMRDDFETQVLAMENNHGDDADALRKAGLEIANKVYGADWKVVAAETKRSLAELPVLDLAAYEAATPIPSNFDGSMITELAPFMTPAGLAMMRFWDAGSVGFMVATMSVDISRGNYSAAMIGLKLSMVPGRVWRGKFKGEDVMAARYMRQMVIIPYTFSAEGMILPTFASVRVYDLQPAKAAQ